ETTTIPIVMIVGFEPVRLGLITSLARPEGNITGVTWFTLLPKQMELLKEIVPNLRRVAYVVGVAGDTNAPPEYFKISEETRQIAAARLDLHGRFFQLPSRTITTKSLPALRQSILMPLISQAYFPHVGDPISREFPATAAAEMHLLRHQAARVPGSGAR